MKIISSLAVLMTISSGLTANAQNTEAENAWGKYDFRLTILNQKKPSPEDAHKYKGEALTTSSELASGLLFICMNEKLRVSAATTPQNLRKTSRIASRSAKRVYVDMSLNDNKEKTSLGRWVYANDTKIIRSAKRSSAAKLYNAVIRQQKVTLHIGGKKPVTLTLPKPNSDFNTFGAACGLGTLAKKK